ncbi:hypothetical protein DET50_11677 [Marinobacter pelagius]|uniref:Uncharacterized protein n=1 Tax=Marinobacter pelagius TaxID=379482 RepID=A0A366GJA5_9GAMM|nr:hypothetical protein [Marinobacter pelagius]RBP27019.1 hypothetical protein DET50_11677 [Marinobacter pelagius]
MPEMKSSEVIGAHFSTRNWSGADGWGLEDKKRQIYENRNATYPVRHTVRSICEDFHAASHSKVAEQVARDLANGHRIMIVGAATGDVLLGVATFLSAVMGIARAVKRTRDVTTTRLGSLGEWSGSENILPLLMDEKLMAKGEMSECAEKVKAFSPHSIIFLNPPFALRDNELFTAELVKSCKIMEVSNRRQASILAASDASLDLSSCGESSWGEAPVPLCLLIHLLTFQIREETINIVSTHPRAQALMMQLGSLKLEVGATLAGFSAIFGDSLLTDRCRVMASFALDQLNRGWSLPPRTAHSRELMSFGLRALLAQGDIKAPVTCKDLRMQLKPLLDTMVAHGEWHSLLECLLTSSIIKASDKSARAAYLVSCSEDAHYSPKWELHPGGQESNMDVAQSATSHRISSINHSDGMLSPDQRVYGLAHWLEKQPWGSDFPEPEFEQEFIVRERSVVAETHQQFIVVDFGQPTDLERWSNRFALVWKESIGNGMGPIKEGAVVRVRYKLQVNRAVHDSEVFGLVTELVPAES